MQLTIEIHKLLKVNRKRLSIGKHVFFGLREELDAVDVIGRRWVVRVPEGGSVIQREITIGRQTYDDVRKERDAKVRNDKETTKWRILPSSVKNMYVHPVVFGSILAPT